MTSRRAEQSFPAAVARLHAAMAQVANGDIGAITALYSHCSEATSFYGWGGYEKGWGAVAQRWDWASQQFKGGTVSYENITTVVTAELAYATDIEEKYRESEQQTFRGFVEKLAKLDADKKRFDALVWQEFPRSIRVLPTSSDNDR